MQVTAVSFSPTGTSKTGAEAIARAIDPDAGSFDLTRYDAPLPAAFGADALVVFGAPVYAGRLYEGFAARLAKMKGSGTPCIVTVTYGNRHYDDALLEMEDIVREAGFVPFAAAALVAQHTYGEFRLAGRTRRISPKTALLPPGPQPSLRRAIWRGFPSPETVLTAQAAHAANSVR